ncbi:MAG: DUF2336 domain-containing protein [Salinarimonas sp.]|nr:DUF2336 domain-containing protein [Salinarimonas sp.]
MLERLSEMSADSSSEGRRTLLSAVTDLFLVDEEASAAATEHYTEIAERSLDAMGSDDRAAYAERVAAEPQLPNPIAKRLASDDEAGVAQLVLRLSPVLSDDDLAAIAVTHSQTHLAAIAERASLSETVTDVLVQRGDRKVLRTVSGNEGAAFSDQGLDTLITRGDGDTQIARNLAERSDSLPSTQARRVLQIAAQMSLTHAPEVETEVIDASKNKHFARKARERRLEVRLLIADLKEGKRGIDEVVTLLCKDDRAFDLAQVISTFSDIPNTQALRALLQKEASGIAVACKAMALGSGAFKDVLTMRASRLGIPAKQIDRDLASYDELTAEMSERAMRFLKVRSKVS